MFCNFASLKQTCMINVAINGFGRIGRNTLRTLFSRQTAAINVVAVNDLADAGTLAHLFKYDSVHGPFPGTVEVAGSGLLINGRRIAAFAERDPVLLPWKELQVDVVIESTGRFTTAAAAAVHLQAGAGRRS